MCVLFQDTQTPTRDARIRCSRLQHAGKDRLGRNSAVCGAAMAQLHSRDDPLKRGREERDLEEGESQRDLVANISTPRAPQTRRALVWSVADTVPRVCAVSVTLTCLPPSVCERKTSFLGEKRVQCTVCVRACAYTCVRRFSCTCHQWRWIHEGFPREKCGVRCSQPQLQHLEESDDA